ncbi:cobalamin biosynthesis protein CbiX [Streptomyces sp. NPDC014764]|uniref:cobalamin biosynthesis protein CbiX n=1 Tax=Streptomyces sp. NPDC014764 TaxID=3364907 RepID=UPI0036FC12EA
MFPGEVVAVGGHESDGGRALRGLLDPRVPCVPGGRELFRRVSSARARGEPVCVVPMTLGRDPDLVADAARTLLALSPADRAGTVLAEPFGTADHLVGWLRAAAARVAGGKALLVTAPSGDPFADADLFRIARLVRQYGRHRTVEVALIGGDPDPAEGVRRCRALGERHVVLLPAAWVTPEIPDLAHCEQGGPLLPAPAVAGVLDARVRAAWDRHDALGDDGMSRGLSSAHGHGLVHSHGPGGHDHDHGPAHPDGPHGPHGTHTHAHDPQRPDGEVTSPQGHRAPDGLPHTHHRADAPALRGAVPHLLPSHRSLR